MLVACDQVSVDKRKEKQSTEWRSKFSNQKRSRLDDGKADGGKKKKKTASSLVQGIAYGPAVA
jgi:hypothetical protein